MQNLIKKQLGSVIACFAKMPKWSRIWLLSMGLLSLLTYFSSAEKSAMGGLLFITLMMIICLPSSALVVIWLFTAADYFGKPNHSFFERYILSPGPHPVSDAVWHIIVLFLVGYLQWFVVFPALGKLLGKGKS